MKRILLENIERAKMQYFDVVRKPERYRKKGEFESAQSVLIALEGLAIELGYIKSGTI